MFPAFRALSVSLSGSGHQNTTPSGAPDPGERPIGAPRHTPSPPLIAGRLRPFLRNPSPPPTQSTGMYPYSVQWERLSDTLHPHRIQRIRETIETKSIMAEQALDTALSIMRHGIPHRRDRQSQRSCSTDGSFTRPPPAPHSRMKHCPQPA